MSKFGLPLFALIAGMISLPAAAAAMDGNTGGGSDNYLSIQLNYSDPDTDRSVDGQGTGATFLYGNRITRRWFLETHISGFVLERGANGGTDFYQQDIGVDAVYRFGEAAGWRPFALLGISAVRNDVDVEAQDGIDAAFHAGGGIVSAPLGRMNIRFRAEVRYVHDRFQGGVQDLRLGLGLEIPLGRSETGFASQPDASAGAGIDDADDDGVVDTADRCPNSLPYVRHDTQGCMQPDQKIRMYEVTFNNGTSILTPAARAELGEFISALRGQPELRVQIQGHTDSWGSAEDNRRLSHERAEAVATFLVLQGVPTQRLTVKGFGETQPVDSNATAAGRERNRRIEFVLLEPIEHQVNK